MSNSPSPDEQCNCVAIIAKAGKGESRFWFSFLLSVTPIKKGSETLSNALPYDDDMGEDEEEGG